MLKQWLRNWLGIQTISDKVVLLEHKRDIDAMEDIIAGLDDSIAELAVTPGDVVEPDVNFQGIDTFEVLKGYDRPKQS